MHQNPSNSTHSSEHTTKPAAKREIAKDAVRFRAYQIYLARNGQPGHELDDWLQAEREILSRI
jgi:hypothetical protein